jgi:hypothetical protein
MSLPGLGLGYVRLELDPNDYLFDPSAAALARSLTPLLAGERQQRREAERSKYLADPQEAERTANHFGGLLGPAGVPGRDYFRADSLPWHDLLSDVEVLGRCAEALEMLPSDLARKVSSLFFPPNAMQFFWMGAALDSVPFKQATLWRQQAQELGRQLGQEEARRATSEAASKAGKASAAERQEQARAKPDEVWSAYVALRGTANVEADKVKLLAERFNVGVGRIRQVLRQMKAT